ncbi:arylesterase [Synechococcus sp. RSCCF101]|uniref:GDSL-type esterase/lipase family protein n=1 Tax=Synechococcus sp. RSCCF101 TaxID=2511069 RepID=UPI001245DEF4|nr:GDSL-type esterase/lipase family protein [Synechococcus sp. RSCCF101]QEY31836.1 arylesterase [Synechococcus sp. RSCCF101]
MTLPVPRKLVVMGDSTVQGWGDSEAGGWCERLRLEWMAQPLAPVIYNLGVRGDGLERLARRCLPELEVRGELRRQIPQGLLLQVGLNDSARVGRANGRPQLSPEGFGFGLNQLLQELQQHVPVLVLGLTPVDESMMPFAGLLHYSNADVRLYESLIEEACLERDVPFLPLIDALLGEPDWLQWLSPDGIHLNSEGHAELHRRISRWPALLRWAGLEARVMATPG